MQSYNYGGWGYYTDEGSRDEIFTNNIALRTKCAGHHQHYAQIIFWKIIFITM